MQITIGKIIALLITVGYIVFMAVEAGGAFVVFRGSLILIFPLGLIWFPEELGCLTGVVRGGRINVETPPILVSIMGWFFLVGLPVIIYFIGQ